MSVAILLPNKSRRPSLDEEGATLPWDNAVLVRGVEAVVEARPAELIEEAVAPLEGDEAEAISHRRDVGAVRPSDFSTARGRG